MAKDPAINWYFDNWAGGTKGMTRHQKGCYMDLLEAQFYLGPLSLEQIKNILGPDFNQWNFLSGKFEITQNGKLYFNERLEAEKEKRRRYSESRKNGKAGRKKSHDLSYDNHMNNHMEITPGIGIETEIEKKVEKTEIVLPFKSKEFFDAWELWKKYKKEQYKFKFKSELSEKASLNHLFKLSEGDENKAIKIIHQSIENTWKGLFELKNNNNANSKNNGLGTKSGGFGILSQALQQA